MTVHYKNYILLLFLFFCSIEAWAQNSTPLLDSLVQYAKLLRNQKEVTDTSARTQVIKNAEVLAAQAQNPEEKLFAYKIRGAAHTLRKQKPKAWFWYKRALKLSRELNDKHQEANICYNLSHFLMDAGQQDSALVYAERALEIDEQREKPIYSGYDLVQIGDIYMQMHHPKQAKHYFTRARQVFEKASFPFGRLLVLEKLAALSLKENQTQPALLHYKAMHSLADSLSQDNFALKALNEAIKVSEKNKDYKSIRRYITHSQQYLDSKDVAPSVLATAYSLSAAQEQRAKRYYRAIVHEQKALKINTELDDNEAQVENHKRLAEIWLALDEAQEAYAALTLAFEKLRLSKNKESQLNLKEAELRFALNLTQKELELTLEKEAEERQQNTIIYSLIGVTITLMGIILSFVYRLAHQRKSSIKNLEKNNMIINQKNEELKELNEVLDAYSSTVSHDLRSPINSMLGLLEVAKHDDDQTLREIYFPMFEKNLHKLRNFIEDLLAHTKNQRQALKPKLIELDLLISEVMEQVIPQDGEVAGKVEITGSKEFTSDPVYLQLILNNLISNAVNYKDSRKEKPYVKVKVEVEPEKLHITVSDNGLGIPEAQQGKVFEMFHRVHTGLPGTGLGLHIVQTAVKKLQGELKLESTEGKGTTFQMQFPLLAVNTTQAPSNEEELVS